MCLALPMQVVRMEGTTAVCESRNGIERVDTMLTGALEPGQWILGFLGAAREIIDAARAAEVANAIDGLQAILNAPGNVDDLINSHFADLVGREPQLPEFLRPANQGANPQ